MPNVVELRAQRVKLIEDAKKLHKLAADEKRSLTGPELEQANKYMDEADKFRVQYETIENEARSLERVNAAMAELNESAGRVTQPNAVAGNENRNRQPAEVELRYKVGTGKGKRERRYRFGGPLATDEYRSALRSYFVGGRNGVTMDEYRALQAGLDPKGGYFIGPQVFVNELIKFLDNDVFARRYATVLPPITDAVSVGAPSLDTDVDDAAWTTELQTIAEDDAMVLGKRELIPHPSAKLVKVSAMLLRRSAMPAESIVMDRFRYKFGVTEEKAFLTGSGVAQPLGIFTASADGVTTTQDVNGTDGTTHKITVVSTLAVKFDMKQQYWPRVRWLFHRSAIGDLAATVATTGQPLWQPSQVAGEPDRLHGIPIDLSEYCPYSTTTGQYAGALVDWSRYWIQDALGMTVQRLEELFALNSEVGFIGRKETDGMPVLAEAFRRVKVL